jgi:hypothetical protein
VEVVRIGVVKKADVASSVPPDAALYHWYVPPGELASRVAVVPTQIVTSKAVTAGGIGVTATVTAVLGPVQPLTIAWT